MTRRKSRLGMVGLGVMGRNLLFNMAEHGFVVAGYDKDPEKVDQLRSEAGALQVSAFADITSFINELHVPRSIMLLVPAGPIVDDVIRDLLPHLQHGDLIIDAGNSHFTDTDVRECALEQRGIYFCGMGVSGGEAGARHGPSLMPGGSRRAYRRVQAVFESVAAHVDGDPCVSYLGPHSAGHYVKMVHNGIEYGMMQLIAETYDILSQGVGLTDDALADVFAAWNQAELNSYLVEITADIFRRVDELTGKRLVDVVSDAAHQLGTGMWTTQDALTLHVPTPTIDTAVVMRNLSGLEDERLAISRKFGKKVDQLNGEKVQMIDSARRGLYAAMILTYAQGFAQLQAASHTYHYKLNLSEIARIWRGGCIIRSRLLEPVRTAYSRRPDLPHLLLDETLGAAVTERLVFLRGITQTGIRLGIPVPGLTATLSYIDSLRAAHLPANLIQAQRDYFGAHTYERVDQRGVFHTQWSKDEA